MRLDPITNDVNVEEPRRPGCLVAELRRGQYATVPFIGRPNMTVVGSDDGHATCVATGDRVEGAFFCDPLPAGTKIEITTK